MIPVYHAAAIFFYSLRAKLARSAFAKGDFSMQDKNNPLRNAELYIEQNANMIDGIPNNAPPPPVPDPGREPLDRVKHPPNRSRSREREER